MARCWNYYFKLTLVLLSPKTITQEDRRRRRKRRRSKKKRRRKRRKRRERKKNESPSLDPQHRDKRLDIKIPWVLCWHECYGGKQPLSN